MFREIRTKERITEEDRKRNEVIREHDYLFNKWVDCLIGTPSWERCRDELRRFEEMHPEITNWY